MRLGESPRRVGGAYSAPTETGAPPVFKAATVRTPPAFPYLIGSL
jgi:hypothetical protein